MDRRLGLIAALLLLGATPAWSQTPAPADPAQDPPASTVEDVIVVDGRLEALARSYVESVAEPPRGRGLARWIDPVCVGVVNFRRPVAEYIADSILQLGEELGVPAQGEGCEPNVFIIGADQAREVAAEWVRLRPRDFRPECLTRAVPPRSALARFAASDAAVRWWQVSEPQYFDIWTGRAAPICGPNAAPIRIYAKSQVEGRIRDNLSRVVVIVDVDRLEGKTIDQISAYLALIAFAQIDPEADTAEFDTILNLFDRPSAPPGLTEWDRAYLNAMYAARTDARLNGVQQAEGLVDVLRTGETAPAE